MEQMLPSISCLYVHYNREPINFTFIRFEKFVRVILNARAVIMTINQLVENVKLFKFYKLSLLLTTDTNRISTHINNLDGRMLYGIMAEWYWKHLYFSSYEELTLMEKSPSRNPLNASEPKRVSSNKKFNKFQKLFKQVEDSNKVKEPEIMLSEFIQKETYDISDYIQRVHEYEMMIQVHSSLMHNVGRDVYSLIKKFM